MIRKARDSQELQPSLSKMIKRTRRSLFYAALFSLCLNLVMLALPLYSLQVLDRVMSSASLETLVMLTLITLVAFVFYSIFMAVRGFILSGVSEWLDHSVAPQLVSEAVVRSSLGSLSQAGQFQRDLMAIKSFISGGPLATLLDAPWSFIFILVIYMINPWLGVLAVFGLVALVGFGVINELATRKVFKKSAELSTRSQMLADTASNNAEAIESMGMMENVLASWRRFHQESGYHQSVGTRRGTLIQSVSRFIRMGIQIGVTAVGGYLVLQHQMTVGGMIAGSILVGRALAPFEGAISIWKSWISARDAWERLGKALGASDKLERGTVALPAPQGLLTVENVIYTPVKNNPIIKGISFSIMPGESLGIIGPSAAGKSTMAKLLVGLLPPSHGAIRLDGAETFKWNRADFGQYVGYLPQHVDLFDGTIKDNIARLNFDAPMESVIEAARKAHVHELILRLPNGYETECGIGNLGLSPGQRQRIGLARALYGQPRFIVLDEPNSNLDGEGERALIDTLKILHAENITTVVVAHRPTIVSTVDKLLVLRSGTIEKFGPREDILRQYASTQVQAAAQKAVSG